MILRYWHTIRYLRLTQITGRLINVVKKRRRLIGLNKPFVGLIRSPVGSWQNAADRHQSMFGEQLFSFLNEQREITNASDWNHHNWPKLWLYNLHYFDDLNATQATHRNAWHRSYIDRWIDENPPAIGNGWEAYPSSLRIVNWIKWGLSGNKLEDRWIQSLVLQVRHLNEHLETHLLGNHLFANAKALTFAGLYFQGDEAQQWLATGLKLIDQELPEQILVDGGNFERSPMYHSIFLEDILDLINIVKVFPFELKPDYIETWENVAKQMLRWLACMCHPDGEISLFNDAAFAVVPAPAKLFDYARRLELNAGSDSCVPDQTQSKHQISLNHLAASGYIRLATEEVVALLDVAPVGPDYLPAHAHADTLSFELSVHNHRLVVNGGTSRYGADLVRLFERGTKAHSTVQIGDYDSSEVWGGFRVARRAKPIGLSITESDSEVQVSCAHDGYRRLPMRPLHTRSWSLSSNQLLIEDTVAPGEQLAVARYIFHPLVTPLEVGETTQLYLPNKKLVVVKVLNGKAKLTQSYYACEFGCRIPTVALSVQLIKGKSQVLFEWDEG